MNTFETLLLTPPLLQMNTPYPATSYLTGYLRSQGHNVSQKDLSLDVLLKLFCKSGLEKIRKQLNKNSKNDTVKFFFEAFDEYHATIDPVIRFLQNSDPSIAIRISQRTILPEGPRFLPLQQHEELLNKFGSMGVQDKAKYLASLYLDDIADVIREGIDSHFHFSRYAESLASSQESFSPLYKKMLQANSLIDDIFAEVLSEYLKNKSYHLVGITIPFPGNLYGGLKAAQIIKKLSPNTKVVIGGGFVNTELRELSDPRIFEFIDYMIFDDGEQPLELLIDHLTGKLPESGLLRTWQLKDGNIVKSPITTARKYSFKELATPTYDGLPINQYFSMLELPNPMHRLWSDLKWNKMILAHGCYWKKCNFCDVNLDYISHYEPKSASQIVDTMEKLMMETGSSGFHFVDEAAPPALLKLMAEEIIRRGLKVSWWGNIRFDKFFTSEVVELLADSGCIAVTGGLEIANSRLLKLINKGVTVEQVTKVTAAFRDAGIYVHAYLMYGFPSQTEQETIDSLEVVRQLFKDGNLKSAHWHRFVCTIHSPVGKSPEKFGVSLIPQAIPSEGLFARYSIPYSEKSNVDHETLGRGLRKAVYNYMHGIGLKDNLQSWFEVKIPKPSSVSTFESHEI